MQNKSINHESHVKTHQPSIAHKNNPGKHHVQTPSA